MSVGISADRIVLADHATVEDAEPLLRALIERPDCAIDVSELASAHFAVVQLLMAARRPIIGAPRGRVLRDLVLTGLHNRNGP